MGLVLHTQTGQHFSALAQMRKLGRAFCLHWLPWSSPAYSWPSTSHVRDEYSLTPPPTARRCPSSSMSRPAAASRTFA
eukprot:363984-Chlamydomonas_euryale.AAC.14